MIFVMAHEGNHYTRVVDAGGLPEGLVQTGLYMNFRPPWDMEQTLPQPPKKRNIKGLMLLNIIARFCLI